MVDVVLVQIGGRRWEWLRPFTLLILGVLLTACTQTTKTIEIDRIIAFGDSNLDTVNMYRLTDHSLPKPPSWNGRVSNGPLLSEYLAQDLGAQLKTYAVSGATSGTDNILTALIPESTQFENTGVLGQVVDYQASLKTFSPHDLVLLMAGSNDLYRLNRPDKAKLQRKINGVVKNLNQSIDALQHLGARNIIVFTRTPRSNVGNDDDLNGVALNEAIFQWFHERREKTGFDVRIFDAYSAIETMILNPEVSGFSSPVGALCIDAPECVSESYEEGLNVANTYVNWDAAHKTTRVHRLLADQLLELLLP